MDAYQTACLEHWASLNGYTVETLKVVRFLDQQEDWPWFYRKFDAVGTIQTYCDGGHPINASEVLKLARDTWGPDVSVLW